MDSLAWFDATILALVLLFFFVFLFMVLYSIYVPIKPITEMELHNATCYQMRESGCSEEEIEKFMSDNNGYYDKDYE